MLARRLRICGACDGGNGGPGDQPPRESVETRRPNRQVHPRTHSRRSRRWRAEILDIGADADFVPVDWEAKSSAHGPCLLCVRDNPSIAGGGRPWNPAEGANRTATYGNLALLELNANNPAVAARWFAEALSLDPASATAREGLARARAAAGQRDP